MNTTCPVNVLDGDQPLEQRVCRLARLRDGRRAAIWRGLAYPLGQGDTIDIAGEGVPPAECLPSIGETSPAAQRLRWTVIEGVGEVWVLIAGNVADRDAAAGALRQAGLAVLRSGPWLGDPAEGVDADWFVRVARPNDGEALPSLLERVLGERAAAPAAGPADDLRLALVGVELGRARTEAAALRTELGRLRMDAAGTAALTARIAALQADLARALAELEAQKAAPAPEPFAPASARAVPPAPAAPTPTRLSRRLQEEVATVLGALAPGVRLLRDSLVVASAEFRDRAAFYRAVAELSQGIGRLPPAWKKLRGLDAWWERHVSTGEDDAGRAYARAGRNGSAWEVLLSHKAEQDRDIAWLRSLG